jgi:hypothetical protein
MSSKMHLIAVGAIVGVVLSAAFVALAFATQSLWPIFPGAYVVASAEEAAYDALITSDQNIRHQRNLTGRRHSLVVPGSNIWPIVRGHEAVIAPAVDAAASGTYQFIEMPLPIKPRPRPK